MVLLARVNDPGFQLWVCGAPSREWIEWLLTTKVPLAPEQLEWKRRAEERQGMKTKTGRVSRGGPQLCECPYFCDRCHECEDCACECHETPVATALDTPPRSTEPPRPLPGAVLMSCGHRYLCDRCGTCEECVCECDEVMA